MAYTETTIADTLVTIGDAVRAALAANQAAGGASGGAPDGFRVTYPLIGPTAWDNCECGLLTLSVGRVFRWTSFPLEVGASGAPLVRLAPCNQGRPGADVTLELLRCVPAPDMRGNPPTPQAQAAWSRTALADQHVTARALCQVLGQLQDDKVLTESIVNPFQAANTEGGCGGWTVLLNLGW